MFVYLAGAIDHISAEESREWREQAAGILAVEGIAVYSPPHAFSLLPGRLEERTCEKVIEVNNQALHVANLVLANLAGKSFGTPIEINTAIQRDIPVYAFNVSESSIYRHKMFLCESLEKAINEIIGLKKEYPIWHEDLAEEADV